MSVDEEIALSAPIQRSLPVRQYSAGVSVRLERRRADSEAKVTIEALQIHRDHGCPLCPAPPPPPPPPAAAPIDEPLQAEVASFVVGGKEVNGEFPNVVAIKTAKGYCTGTVIDPRLVLTASHCHISVGAPVYVGDDVHAFGAYHSSVEVLLWPPLINKGSAPLEFGAKDRPLVVVLKSDVSGFTKPYYFASAGAVAPEPLVRVVGFGFANKGESKGLGRKRYADVEMRSASCSETLEDGKNPANYECIAGLEMIAGGGGLDTCQGDSGGPLFIAGAGKTWILAALTSRGIHSHGCGSGGIYILLHHWTKWIKDLQFSY